MNGTLITLLGDPTSRFSYWSPERVEQAILDKEPVPLIDGEKVNPNVIATWVYDGGAIARELENRRQWAAIRKDIHENGPLRGSPDWVEQQPFGTRWFHWLFTEPRS